MTGASRPAQGALAPDVEAWLRAGAGGSVACDKVVETSISWLFLYPGRVLKLKKPVDLGFVDFTTTARRCWAAERELRFNRRASPGLYNRTVNLCRTTGGEIEADGEGELVEIAVEMRRFEEDAILARRLPLAGSFCEGLGRLVGRAHATAAPGFAGAGAQGLDYVIQSNVKQLEACAEVFGSERIGAVVSATELAFAGVRGLLDERAGEGFCRACHGDLHLSNIIVEAGEPWLFDCIEFSDRLREIDVAYDIAFLLMDLAIHGFADSANRVLNGWLDEAARGFPHTIWAGLAALPLFQSVRATVRAHVSAREARIEEADRYLDAALAHLTPRSPRLIAVGGLSGAGKTTRARLIAPSLGHSPGAVLVRSDEVRKRLWGVQPTDRLPPQAYGEDPSAKVYAELVRVAEDGLAAGFSVVVDAAFLSPDQRGRIEKVAASRNVPFEGVWLEASADVLRERLAARRGDASDADVGVLERQLAIPLGEIGWRRG
jgi:aminoglycoside phosphotransferase family enzyme/predicted kinase